MASYAICKFRLAICGTSQIGKIIQFGETTELTIGVVSWQTAWSRPL